MDRSPLGEAAGAKGLPDESGDPRGAPQKAADGPGTFTEPRFLPAILAFLGYDPRPEAQTFGERIRRKRAGEGLTIEGLAERLGLDPATVWAWETDRIVKVYPRVKRVFEDFLKGDSTKPRRANSIETIAAPTTAGLVGHVIHTSGIYSWRIFCQSSCLYS